MIMDDWGACVDAGFQSRGTAAVIDEEPLPAGWAMGTAPNGRVFYIDHNNATTTWVSARTPDICLHSYIPTRN